MRGFLTIAALSVLGLGAVSAHAEEAAPPNTGLAAPYRAQVDDAIERGRLMFLYDQAAWHATDQMFADLGNAPDKRMRGYVILPGDTDQTLLAVFYGDVEGRHVEFARYGVEVDKIVSSKVFAEGERPPLPPLAERLIAARDTAIGELITQKYGFCGNAQPNYVLLPSGDDGVISAYFLTPQVDGNRYPLGGHYRVDIGADGKVVSSRKFMNTCFEVNLKDTKDEDGKPMTPTAMFVTHLLDPQPTEIHIFASYYLPIELMIATTENRIVWEIDKGRVKDVRSIDQAPEEKD